MVWCMPRCMFREQLLLTKATFLDPRLKTLSFFSQGEIEDFITNMESEGTNIAESVEENSETAASLIEPAAKHAKGEHKLLDLIGDTLTAQPTGEQPQIITPFRKPKQS